MRVAVSIVYIEINSQLWNSTTKFSMFLNILNDVKKKVRNNRKLEVDSALIDVIVNNN